MIESVVHRFQKFRQQSPIVDVLMWGVVLTLGVFFGQYLDMFKAWIWNLLPITIGSLTRAWWLAFGFTVGASLLAWVFAVLIGFGLGVVAAAARVSVGPEVRLRRWLGISVDVAYRFIYIIPFVLTANIAYNITFTWQDNYGLPQWFSGVAMVIVAGAALGGYKVFIAIYGAVSEAKLDSILLSRSLFAALHPGHPHALGFRESVKLVLRLRDCEIAGFTRALEDSFHLSLVAVMIVESILPAFYENFVRGTGSYSDYFGGVGRMIMTAQQSLTPRLISGILWLVLIFDGIVIAIIRGVSSHRWHKHYHQERREVA